MPGISFGVSIHRFHPDAVLAPAAVYGVLAAREQHVGIADDIETASGPEDAIAVSPLFYGFPQFPGSFDPIIISTSRGTQTMKLTIRVEWEDPDSGSIGPMVRIQDQGPSFTGGVHGTAMLVGETELNQSHGGMCI